MVCRFSPRPLIFYTEEICNALSREIITAIIMFYKNMLEVVLLPDSITGFFDVISGVLERDTLAPFLFIIYGVMVIVVGNGHGDTSSNPGRDWLHFTYH